MDHARLRWKNLHDVRFRQRIGHARPGRRNGDNLAFRIGPDQPLKQRFIRGELNVWLSHPIAILLRTDDHHVPFRIGLHFPRLIQPERSERAAGPASTEKFQIKSGRVFEEAATRAPTGG